MTPTARIAGALFGWNKIEAPPECNPRLTWYERGEDLVGVNQYGCCLGGSADGADQWPEFDKERLSYYWIRRMEDAIAGKSYGLWAHYLDEVEKEFRKSEESCNLKSGVRTAIARATPEQRVAAAIAVLDQAEAKKQEGQG